MNRTPKQTIIALIFFIVLAGLGTGSYWLLTSRSSCFDNIQNYGETGVDCGGLCAMCLEKRVQPFIIQDIDFVQTNSNSWDFVAFIENPNKTVAATRFIAQWQILDDVGEVIKSFEQDNYILPGEEKILALVGARLNSAPIRVNLLFKEIDWLESGKLELPAFLIKDAKFQKRELGRSVIAGSLVNSTPFSFDAVNLVAVIYNQEEGIVGINSTELRTILTQEERFFEMSWFNPLSTPDKIEVKASTNIFDKDNFIRGEGKLENFQRF